MNPGDKLIKKPVYQGGRKALSEFLQTNMIYPSDAIDNKIEGLVIAYIDIDGHGNVSKARLKKKLGYGCDEEALRLVKLLQFFVVKKRKVRITHHKTIKVHFKLPSPPKSVKKATQKTLVNTKKSKTMTIKQETLEISYTFVPSKKNQN